MNGESPQIIKDKFYSAKSTRLWPKIHQVENEIHTAGGCGGLAVPPQN